MRLSKKKKLAFIAAALLASFVVFEVGIRVVFGFRVGPHVLLYGTHWARNEIKAKNVERNQDHTVVFHENPGVGYTKYFPHQSLTDHVIRTGDMFAATVNDRGFRGADFASEKAPGVTRVVTLGASSTFGFGDRDTETYPHFLEQRLNANGGHYKVHEPRDPPPLVGSDPRAYFRQEVLPLHADVVTFYEGVNDCSSDDKTGAVAQGPPDPRPDPELSPGPVVAPLGRVPREPLHSRQQQPRRLRRLHGRGRGREDRGEVEELH